MKFPCLVLALAALLPACSRTPSKPPAPVDAPVAADAPAPPGAKTATKDDHVIGAPRTFENLTVFPITSRDQVDVGPLTTLEAALQAHDAEVREMGSEPAPATSVDVRNPVGNEQAFPGSGPRVNTLVIENKGTVPIYVLAGTVVKGGNQDRQIGQDFIIAAKQVAGVDAYCVEHGRWTGQREGKGTEGKFDTVSQLVNSGVRAAGQYQQNQSEVWANVAQVNAANGKAPSSGTLLATLDDGEVARHRAALAAQVMGYLREVQPANDVVGVAYAVDGKVRGARWFVNHRIFDLYRTTLVNTAAVDAITAAANRDPQAAKAPVPALTPRAVTAFIEDIEAAKVKATRDAAAGANEYRESARGYGSKAMMKMPAAAAATASPAAVPISQDYLVR
jgi:hypothetical protein